MENNEEAKRQLHALLREYKSNCGMAAMVCSRPVELLPESEQQRLFKGFFTSSNAKAFRYSLSQIEKAKKNAQQLSLDDSERTQIENALTIVPKLLQMFSHYQNGEMGDKDVREEVRKLLCIPIPESEAELIESLSHCVKTLIFLGDQPIREKDQWDRLVDSVQLHDALSRTLDVSRALGEVVAIDHASPGGVKPQSMAVKQTHELCSKSLSDLEQNFRAGNEEGALPDLFAELGKVMKQLWYEDQAD